MLSRLRRCSKNLSNARPFVHSQQPQHYQSGEKTLLNAVSQFLFTPLFFLVILITGISAQADNSGLNNRQADNFRPAAHKADFISEVKPVLDQRCVVCHGCYDAPCQLKLSSIEGLQRGASKKKVYEHIRLRAAKPTRLFEDAQTTEQWRKLSFFPVINEGQQSTNNNLNDSVLVKILRLKRRHPLPNETPLPDSFDFSLNNATKCVALDEFDDYAEDQPLWGMPYGLPQLTQNEYQTLLQWIAGGAQIAPPKQRPEAELQAWAQWEDFLNGDSLKQQLMSRYIYEHLFFGHIYFSEQLGNKADTYLFYHIVRSKTPPGKPVERIATVRPYDEPGVARVYYRLIPDHSSTVVKTHMPYLFNQQRMDSYQTLFIDADYKVKQLPDYQLKNASNPFITFDVIPVRSRYKFMLDEAQFTIMGFIKGPVCRGQIALNVIQDHFWVFFTDPDLYLRENETAFLIKNMKNMSLPAQGGSNASIFSWLKYSRQQEKFLKAKSELIDKNASELKLTTLWDGKQKNKNAALTIFRHFDSASVVQGLVGENPKTAWVVGYSLLERIHYLLVAGYDVFGNTAHQLNTRLYMDFLRYEGEFNFLAFLPEKSRAAVRDEWYVNADSQVKNHLYGRYAWLNSESKIHYKTTHYKTELYSLLKKRLGDALNTRYSQPVNNEFQRLMNIKSEGFQLLAQVSFILVEDGQQQSVYTLIHNNAHRNISSLLKEGSERITKEDTLTLLKGFVGDYPNQFFKLRPDQVKSFVSAVIALHSKEDYTQLLNDYAVRRNDPRFWATADTFYKITRATQPISSGLFDFNRYENR